MLYWLVNEIVVNCLFTQWKWTHILDFGPWKWSAFNMEFVIKWPSITQGQWFFQSQAGAGTSFRSGPENPDFFVGQLPLKESTFLERLVGGRIKERGVSSFTHELAASAYELLLPSSHFNKGFSFVHHITSLCTNRICDPIFFPDIAESRMLLVLSWFQFFSSFFCSLFRALHGQMGEVGFATIKCAHSITSLTFILKFELIITN